MKEEPIVIERTFNAPAAKVWKAISDKDEMKKWYFDLAEFKAEAGFEFRFEGGTEENKYIHICVVQEVVPGKKLSYTWKYENYEGLSLVTFELFDEGKTARVKLTHSGLETFPASNKDFAKENFVMGWTAIIGTELKNYLEK